MALTDNYEFRRFMVSRPTDPDKSYKNPSKKQCELTARKRRLEAELEERAIEKEYGWS